MRIAISHTTRYRFDQPVWHGLQRLRLKPRNCAVQTVLDWSMTIEGGRIEAEYEDHNQNPVALVSFGADAGEVAITCRGVVETRDASGVIGAHNGFMPLWLFCNQTELTKPGPKMRELASRFGIEGANAIDVLHALSQVISEEVAYEAGHTSADTTAEEAFAAGHGVCQDHAHIFIGVARHLGVPARYVSGYLLMDDRITQEAGHAWAEAHVPGLGWVGFDVANQICPDSRYVRLAIGADYRDAAPVTSISQGGGECGLEVALDVAQRQVEQ